MKVLVHYKGLEHQLKDVWFVFVVFRVRDQSGSRRAGHDCHFGHRWIGYQQESSSSLRPGPDLCILYSDSSFAVSTRRFEMVFKLWTCDWKWTSNLKWHLCTNTVIQFRIFIFSCILSKDLDCLLSYLFYMDLSHTKGRTPQIEGVEKKFVRLFGRKRYEEIMEKRVS